MRFKLDVKAICFFGLILGLSTTDAFAARFGTWCTESYESDWQHTLSESWARCQWFVDQLASTDNNAFYYDLSNKGYYWEQYGDHQPALDSADDVDLLFVNTHGGADSGNAVYAMTEVGGYAYSSNMRLGDSAWWGGGLAILATYACETLKSNDGGLVARWGSALRGGLKMVVGSHDKVYSGTTTNEVGEDFAYDLQHGKSVNIAWRDALTDWWLDNDATVVATGENNADCINRISSINWQNFSNYPFIRDNNIGTTCWQSWDDL